MVRLGSTRHNSCLVPVTFLYVQSVFKDGGLEVLELKGKTMANTVFKTKSHEQFNFNNFNDYSNNSLQHWAKLLRQHMGTKKEILSI